jgi:hypothetical protein
MARKSKAAGSRRKSAARKAVKKKVVGKKPVAKKAAAKKPVKAKAASNKPVANKDAAKKAAKPKVAATTGPAAAAKLKFYRHPSSGAYYAAYDRHRVHVKRGNLWGEFDRNGNHLEGDIRYADPTFCRWVTGEHIYNERLLAAKTDVWPLTRLVTEGR